MAFPRTSLVWSLRVLLRLLLPRWPSHMLTCSRAGVCDAAGHTPPIPPSPAGILCWDLLQYGAHDKQNPHPPCSWITFALCWGFRAWNALHSCSRSLGHERTPQGNFLWNTCFSLQTEYGPVFSSAVTRTSLAPVSVSSFCFQSSLGGVLVPGLLWYVAPEAVKGFPASSCSGKRLDPG